MALNPKYKTRQIKALIKNATTALEVKLLLQSPMAANTAANKTAVAAAVNAGLARFGFATALA